MAREILDGPLEQLSLADGTPYPWYVGRFARDGILVSTGTVDRMLGEIEDRPPTDIFVFAHGWNNDWQAATTLYRNFLLHHRELCRERGLRGHEGYRPLLFGVIWPSTTLVLPWEQGPRIAAEPSGDEVHELLESIETAAGGKEARAEAEALLAQPILGAADAERLAELLAAGLGGDVSPADLVAGARGLGEEAGASSGDTEKADEDDGALPGFVGGSSRGAPSPAAWSLRPRRLIRVFSVWTMKDRAGRVGVHGVGPLLARLLTVCGARLHLLGHSFGARVMLTALSGDAMAASRPVRSLLLLQPAVNAWCFAADSDGRGTPGGFRPVIGSASSGPARVELPIVTTFSAHDAPLCRVFPKALRRQRDLGEVRLASAEGGASEGIDSGRWSSLGGVGPLGVDAEVLRVPMPGPGEPYPLNEARRGGLRILAVDGREHIADHGDVANAATAWALQSLVMAE